MDEPRPVDDDATMILPAHRDEPPAADTGPILLDKSPAGPAPVPADVAPSLNFSAATAPENGARLPAIPQPMAPAPQVAVLPPPQTEQVTCPECGRVATVTLTRREATDFCHNCDYPLFWAPSKILLDRSGLSDESLRRLPGTVGRVAIAAFPCPHCAEPNQMTAVDCVRCGRPLRPVHFQAQPTPVYVPPPPMEPEPEPSRVPWWVWAILGFVIVALIVIITLSANGVFDS